MLTSALMLLMLLMLLLFMFLHAVLLLPLEVLLPEGVDTVNHDLDELNLGVSKTMLVGDVVGVASLSAGLSPGSTGLDGELLASGLQLVNSLLGPSGKVDVHGGAHASSKIGGAGVDVAVLLIQTEVLANLSLDAVADSLDSSGETTEDSLDIATLLHGDDAELILLVDPDKEGLGIVVVDAAALGPVALHAGNSQVAITRHEEEVVVDQLLADLLVHASEGVVGAGEVTGHLGESLGDNLLNTDALLLGDSGGETESIDGTTDANTGGVDGDIGVDVSLNLLNIHVRGVLGIGGDSMVLLDDSIKDIGEILVGIPVTGVDAAVLVVELNSAGNGLGEGEAGGLGDDVLVFVPSLLGHVLGHQRVGGLDGGELARHGCFGL